MAELLCGSARRMTQAVNNTGIATSIAPINPLSTSGQADTFRSSVDSSTSAAMPCNANPNPRGIQRACRAPTQNAPAPSSAQAAEVQCASSAKGTASVTNPTPIASRHSFNSRISSRRCRMV